LCMLRSNTCRTRLIVGAERRELYLSQHFNFSAEALPAPPKQGIIRRAVKAHDEFYDKIFRDTWLKGIAVTAVAFWLINRHVHLRDHLEDGEFLEGSKFLMEITPKETPEQAIRTTARVGRHAERVSFQAGMRDKEGWDNSRLKHKITKGNRLYRRPMDEQAVGRSGSLFAAYEQETRGEKSLWLPFWAVPAADHVKAWNDKEIPPIPPPAPGDIFESH